MASAGPVEGEEMVLIAVPEEIKLDKTEQVLDAIALEQLLLGEPSTGPRLGDA